MDQYNPEVVNFLSHLFGRFKLITGFQFGVDDIVHPLMASELVLLKTLCKNSEYFHKVKLHRPNIQYLHYQTDRDLKEWFSYFPYRYDLAVINAGNFDSTNIVLSEMLLRHTPIVIIQNFTRAFAKSQAMYLFERIEQDGEVLGVFYLDMISKRNLLP